MDGIGFFRGMRRFIFNQKTTSKFGKFPEWNFAKQISQRSLRANDAKKTMDIQVKIFNPLKPQLFSNQWMQVDTSCSLNSVTHTTASELDLRFRESYIGTTIVGTLRIVCPVGLVEFEVLVNGTPKRALVPTIVLAAPLFGVTSMQTFGLSVDMLNYSINTVKKQTPGFPSCIWDVDLELSSLKSEPTLSLEQIIPICEEKTKLLNSLMKFPNGVAGAQCVFDPNSLGKTPPPGAISFTEFATLFPPSSYEFPRLSRFSLGIPGTIKTQGDDSK